MIPPPLLPPEVAALVLLAALMHAAWGAMAKGGGRPELDVALMYGVQTLLCLLALPFLPLPDPASWPWLGTAAVIHTVYVGFVIAAYRVGDLSHVYPIMRGTPPLIVAAVTVLWLNEWLSPWAWGGVALICGGVLTLALHRGAAPRATLLALGSAAMTAGYTLVDGNGARAAGSAVAYTSWLFVFNGLAVLAIVGLRNGVTLVHHARRTWRRALVAGPLGLLSYLAVVWAMTRAPIAPVAALRETSVIFAAIIGSIVLKESMGHRRIAAAVIVAAGAVVLKLA